jgi:tetratricopeptide (TPR) repeat protein
VALEFELMPFGHDTPAHVLLQVAAQAPDTANAKDLLKIDISWKERLLAAEAILDSIPARVILLRFPAGSPPGGERPDRQLQQESADVLRLLTKPRPGKLHIIAVQQWWRWPHTVAAHEIQIKVSSRAKEFLVDAGYWGTLAPTAAKLLKLLDDDGDRLSPLQLRLGVALLAGGTNPATVRSALSAGTTLRDLEQPLRRLLDRRPQLAAAIGRVARARTAVDEPVLKDVAAAGDEWEVLSRCFLYPEEIGRLRFHDQLRWLVADASAETGTHARLRGYYEQLDGATDSAQGLKKVIPWLEKLHHASRADAEGNVEAWLALNPPSREHFWEFGWSLSYVHKRYTAAARVFRELLSRVSAEDDNYGQHYFAYNLDKSGGDPILAEKYYRLAVDGDPTNAWWNSRYVTFLTGRGRFEAALRAWNAALEVVDPGGERSSGDWLPFQLHKHVIKAGLDSGNLELADAAFRAIRPPASADVLFQWLGSEIEASRQVRRLGEALFPGYLNVIDWWKPRQLRPRPGENFTDWRAGRVLRVRRDEISLALGYCSPAGHPVLEYQVLSRQVWAEAAGGAEPREGDFLEVARINGKRQLIAEPVAATAEIDRERLANSLRFLSTLPTG